MDKRPTERHEIALDLALMDTDAWTDHGITRLEDMLLIRAAFDQYYQHNHEQEQQGS